MVSVTVTGGGGVRRRVRGESWGMRLEGWVERMLEGPVDHDDRNGSYVEN